ncbi:hypothetical protein BH11PLA2_BH11PLA2_50060 [soil metagenome]
MADSTPATTTGTPVKTNHPIGFWFFFWGEFAERCSYYGMRAILALYMTERLGVDKADASTYMSFFIAACYFFPLIGGWLADNFFGKYWTIVLFSVPYVVAQFMVGIENRYLVLGSLILLAMGSGVIKPNISTLMGMTYMQQRPGQDKLSTSAFSWFYMAINIGAALSQFAMPWLRKNHGYQTAFLFPAALMTLALIIFAMGKRFYAKETIERKVIGGPNTPIPADEKTLTGIPVKYKLYSEEEAIVDKQQKWLILSRIGLVFLTVMFFWAIFDQSASTWVFFADTYMDTTIIGEKAAEAGGQSVILSGDTVKSLLGDRELSMSADAIQGFNPLFIILFVPISVAIFKVVKLKATTKMIIGFALTGVSMAIMSMAGNAAGTKIETVKVVTPEGDFILPLFENKLDTYGGAESATLTGKAKSDPTLVLSKAVYNTNNKKLEFTDGTISFADGRTWKIEKGRLVNRFTAAPAAGTTGGILENNLKSKDDVAKLTAKDADKVTMEIVEWVPPKDRITVWWMIAAFLVITIAEILISVTGLELAFVAAPPNMKSFVTACWLAVVFLANFLINAPITRLYPTMHPGTYFAMLGAAMAVIVVIFIPIAIRFNKAMEQTKKS